MSEVLYDDIFSYAKITGKFSAIKEIVRSLVTEELKNCILDDISRHSLKQEINKKDLDLIGVKYILVNGKQSLDENIVSGDNVILLSERISIILNDFSCVRHSSYDFNSKYDDGYETSCDYKIIDDLRNIITYVII